MKIENFRTLFRTFPHFVLFFRVFKTLLLETKKGCNRFIISCFSLVPGTGIEPVQPQRPQDFKSCVSTSSTTQAEKKAINY
jgi:hypothetical protein